LGEKVREALPVSETKVIRRTDPKKWTHGVTETTFGLAWYVTGGCACRVKGSTTGSTRWCGRGGVRRGCCVSGRLG
jgi:hypothetical protein